MTSFRTVYSECVGIAEATVVSSRGRHWVETKVDGRVLARDIERMVSDYARLGAGATWLIDASATSGYAPDAVQRAAEMFGELSRARGLTRIVALIKSPVVRMGASVVSMMLRTFGSKLEIDIVESESELGALR